MWGTNASRYVRDKCFKICEGQMLQDMWGTNASRYVRDKCFKICEGQMLQDMWGTNASRLAATSDKVYQLLAQGRWFSPASSTTKTGCHDIAEILLKVALNTNNSNSNIIYWYLDFKTSTRREPPTMGKQLVNFITCGCESSASFFVIYKAGRETHAVLVIGCANRMIFQVLRMREYCEYLRTHFQL
jgi:hypothetical protein